MERVGRFFAERDEECFGHCGMKLRAAAPAYLTQRLMPGSSSLIGLFSNHRRERFGDCENCRANGDRTASQTVRVALTIEPFMVIPHKLGKGREWWMNAHHCLADLRVRQHIQPFERRHRARMIAVIEGDCELANIVQQRATGDLPNQFGRYIERFTDHQGVE